MARSDVDSGERPLEPGRRTKCRGSKANDGASSQRSCFNDHQSFYVPSLLSSFWKAKRGTAASPYTAVSSSVGHGAFFPLFLSCLLFFTAEDKPYATDGVGTQSSWPVGRHCEGERSSMQLKGRGRVFQLPSLSPNGLSPSASIPFSTKCAFVSCWLVGLALDGRQCKSQKPQGRQAGVLASLCSECSLRCQACPPQVGPPQGSSCPAGELLDFKLERRRNPRVWIQ